MLMLLLLVYIALLLVYMALLLVYMALLVITATGISSISLVILTGSSTGHHDQYFEKQRHD